MKTFKLIFLFLLISNFLSIAQASPPYGGAFDTWPDTGQTKCYSTLDWEIPCPNPGEDFYGQDAHYQGPQRSYTKLGYNGVELPESATIADGWIMTKDNVTGLTWEIKTNEDGQANYNNPHDANNIYYWCNPDSNRGIGECNNVENTENFINQLNSSNFGGFNDWRMPTIKELLTLVDSSVEKPAINTDYFPNLITNDPEYWSFTEDSLRSDYAWGVDFYFGRSFESKKYDSSFGKHYVMAVRGDQPQLPSVQDNFDGTITDLVTGLMWQKCAMGQTYNPSTDSCDGDPAKLNWQKALYECENLSLAGHSDWKLPNRNELLSIVDYSKYPPYLDGSFSHEVSFPYWSSTTYLNSVTYAWAIQFNYGKLYNERKESSNYYVRAVRHGTIPRQVFDDVSPDYWSYSYIQKLAESGITGGCGNGNFCPSNEVTRAQMAVFLERCMRGTNFIPANLLTPPFGDVPIDYWAGSWIKQLYEDGITRGCGGDNYCPAESVTRAQMAVFLLRAKYGSDYNPPDPIGNFNDVPTNHWAARWIEQLAADGITSGCGNGNYCPEQPVTRAQMAVFLVRTFNLDN